ncbi:MAG: efflux RND transporter periplasmic adaptor subunit [Verrucomicrobia bacterium]|nr:efflux RND transporter periplasmic adaptor subunit [Verrucomicrobiota bacterium]
MRRVITKPVITALVVLLVGGVGTYLWRGRHSTRLALQTALVKRGDLAVTISASGTIEPIEVVDVGAQVAGQISAFGLDTRGRTLDYGSMVEQGAVLARIDESVYAADLGVARAQLEQAKAGELSAAANVEQMKARLVQAQADWKRASELSRSKLIADSDFDSAQANYQVAQANLAVAEAAISQAKASTVQAQAAVERAQRNLDFCTIRSPVSGVIIDRRVNIGQTVVASLNAPSLFLIAKDLTKLQIWVGVNEADVGRIVPGAPVTFTCDAFPGREFTGTVGKVRLNATMTQNVVMYTVEVNTENPEQVLLPYLTANVHFIVRKETGVLLVPNAALRWSPSALVQIAPDARGWKPAATTNDPPPTPAQSGGGKRPPERVGTVWLSDGEFVRPVEVLLGATDGTTTVIPAGILREGQEIVTGELIESGQTGPQNPFLPQLRRR